MRSGGESAQRDHRMFASTLTLLADHDAPEPHVPTGTIRDEAAEIARARQDPAAFAPLYERYVDAIFGYCLRRTSEREQAADMTAQIFTRALAAMPGYVDNGGGGTFRSWLFAIAHNLLVDTYRKQREVVSLDQREQARQVVDRAPGPEEHAIQADIRRAFREALGQLTDGQREVVALRLAGLTGPEIAAVLEMKLAAVKSIQFRAYTRLRELMEPHYTPGTRTPEDAMP